MFLIYKYVYLLSSIYFFSFLFRWVKVLIWDLNHWNEWFDALFRYTRGLSVSDFLSLPMYFIRFIYLSDWIEVWLSVKELNPKICSVRQGTYQRRCHVYFSIMMRPVDVNIGNNIFMPSLMTRISHRGEFFSRTPTRNSTLRYNYW